MIALEPSCVPCSIDVDEIHKNNPWMKLLTEFSDILSWHFEDRIPVGQSLMRGPSDILFALLGRHFYSYFYDQPDRLMVLANQCTEPWIKVMKLQYKHLPLYLGGYCSGIIGIWAPGSVIVYQEDAAGSISPSMYQDFFCPVTHLSQMLSTIQ